MSEPLNTGALDRPAKRPDVCGLTTRGFCLILCSRTNNNIIIGINNYYYRYNARRAYYYYPRSLLLRVTIKILSNFVSYDYRENMFCVRNLFSKFLFENNILTRAECFHVKFYSRPKRFIFHLRHTD